MTSPHLPLSGRYSLLFHPLSHRMDCITDLLMDSYFGPRLQRRKSQVQEFSRGQLPLTQVLQIDYRHPSLGGCFGPGCLVSFGYDLVGDAFNGSNVPFPDRDPFDCGGHGTHVAGKQAPNSLVQFPLQQFTHLI